MLNRSNFPITQEIKEIPNQFPLLHEHYTQVHKKIPTLHYHQCMEIGHCVSGDGLMFVDGTIYSFARNAISIIPQGCVHDSRIISPSANTKPSVWRFLFVDMRKLGITTDEFTGIVTDNKRILQLFDLVYSAAEDKKEAWQQQIIYLLKAFAIEARQANTLAVPSINERYKELILPAQHKILEEYSREDLTVESLARFCGLSISCFRKYFTQAVGMSPQQYLIHMRLSIAKHLLRNSDEKIIVIAQEVGFRTLSSFNRLFLKNYGLSPSEFRRSLAGIGHSKHQ